MATLAGGPAIMGNAKAVATRIHRKEEVLFIKTLVISSLLLPQSDETIKRKNG
jgi:hypothetical protein